MKGPSTAPAENPSPRLHWAAMGLLLLAVPAAYFNSFSGPFIFDDVNAILENPTIRNLGDLGTILNPPRTSGTTVNGRPLVNLSLAINYALGGTGTTGYHFLNLLIHLAGSLAAYGLTRRLLVAGLPGNARDRQAVLPALAVALLWALHPLQTQSVTYVVQRAESLLGLLYLLTLLAFVRSHGSRRPTWWLMSSFCCCLLGVWTKEVIVSAPIVIFLCDRTFFAGSFGAAWRLRRTYHLAMLASWIPLALQIHAAGGRGGTVGFGLSGVSWWMYALTQADALVRYLRLSLWPSNLVFDYGTGVQTTLLPVLPQGLLIIALLSATVWALIRRPVWGFLGASFFLILAPSSSIVPIVTESMAEHRMYLPLLAVVALGAVFLHLTAGRRVAWAGLAACVPLLVLTTRRNGEYQTEATLWQMTVLRYPESARAHNNLGEILVRQHRLQEAVGQFREAVRRMPNYRDALCNLAGTLHRIGEREEARTIIGRLMKSDGDRPEIVVAYGGICHREGRIAEARQAFEKALQVSPDHADANNNYGVILNDEGRPKEAIEHFQRALLVRPNYSDALYNYANSLSRLGLFEEAKAMLGRLLQVDPGYAEGHNNLAALLIREGRQADATRLLQRAVELNPTYPDALNNLGALLFDAGQVDEAIRLLERALAARPDYADARRNLELIRQARRQSAPRP